MNDMRVVLKLDLDARGFAGKAKKAERQTDRLAKSAKKTQKPIEGLGAAGRKAGAGLGNLGNVAASLTPQLGGLGAAATGLTAGLSGAALAIGAVAVAATAGGAAIAKAGDAFKLTEARITALTGSAAAAKETMEGIYDIAIQDGVAIQTLNSLTARFTLSLTDLGKSQKDVLGLTEAVTKLGVIGGASGVEFNAAAIQFSQGLASGRLQGEELRSVLENLPLVAKAIAAELGVGIGALRQMAAEGKVTAEVAFEALMKRLPEIRADFESLPVTMQRGWDGLKSALDQRLVQLDKIFGLSNKIAGLFEFGTDLIKSEQIDSAQGAVAVINNLRKSISQGVLPEDSLSRTIQLRFGGAEKAIQALRTGQLSGLQDDLESVNKQLQSHKNFAFRKKHPTGFAFQSSVNKFEDTYRPPRELLEQQKAVLQQIKDFEAKVNVLLSGAGKEDLLAGIQQSIHDRSARMAGLVASLPALEKEAVKIREKAAADTARIQLRNAATFNRIWDDVYARNNSLLSQYDQQKIAVNDWQAATKTALMEIGKLNPLMMAKIDGFAQKKLAQLAIDEAKRVEDAHGQLLEERADRRAADLASATDWESGIIRGQNAVLAAAKDQASQMENLYTKAFSGITDALTDLAISGKADFKSLADSIIRNMVRIQIQKSITDPLSGLLGGVLQTVGNAIVGSAAPTGFIEPSAPELGLIAGTNHKGGIVGVRDSNPSRLVLASMFDGVPRYHAGGIAGLKSNEVPTILERGEGVFTEGQMKMLRPANDTAARPVVVNIINNTPARVTQQETRTADGGVQLDVMIEQIEGAIGESLSRGEGIAGNIEGRYGLQAVAQ